MRIAKRGIFVSGCAALGLLGAASGVSGVAIVGTKTDDLLHNQTNSAFFTLNANGTVTLAADTSGWAPIAAAQAGAITSVTTKKSYSVAGTSTAAGNWTNGNRIPAGITLGFDAQFTIASLPNGFYLTNPGTTGGSLGNGIGVTGTNGATDVLDVGDGIAVSAATISNVTYSGSLTDTSYKFTPGGVSNFGSQVFRSNSFTESTAGMVLTQGSDTIGFGTATGTLASNLLCDNNFGPPTGSSSLFPRRTGPYTLVVTQGTSVIKGIQVAYDVTYDMVLVDAEWTLDSDGGNWTNGANWAGGIAPNGVNTTARFLAAGSTSGARTVNLDANQTVGEMYLAGTNGYTISSSNSSGLTLSKSTASAVIDVASANHTISVPVTLGSNLTVSSAAGTTLTMSSVTGSTKDLTKSGPGTVVASSLNVANLTVGGGSVQLSGTAPSTVKSVTATAGNLDVNTAKVVVDYTGSGSAAGSVRTALIAGFNGGDWNGATGIKSTAAFGDANDLHAIGYADNADLGVANWPDAGGQAVPASSVLVKYTYYGDADLNGKVDADDYFRIDSNYNKSGDAVKKWVNGDFNYDDQINGDDFMLIDQAYAGQGLALSVAISGVNAVPEPASIGMLGLGALALGRRRRAK
jgi:hypothetical protein